jgi:hypothetical protein
MTLTTCELFVKVTNEAGETIARCDKLADTDQWNLTVFRPTLFSRLVPADQAKGLVLAAAAICGATN